MLDVLPLFVEPSMVARLLVAIFGITFRIAWAIWDLLPLAQILMYGSACQNEQQGRTIMNTFFSMSMMSWPSMTKRTMFCERK
jgi:hypothetical protein